ncbi:MAG: 5'-nucleotidase C-terminal domain-containing protein [Nitrososphaerota archaeon]|jgi:2',3'-cyclic-nucleotide 2'-phosphodiesterase (5'-nucleotidase family)|nr:5'-nucleotidase C-terminal domain-containing protein [Nitrososphaerota archaeon]
MSFVSREGETCTFQILFTSDVHGSFRDYNYSLDRGNVTGFSKIASLMRREKETFDGVTFVVDIGDIIQGNGTNVFIKSNKFKPYPLLAVYDIFGYDMVSIGNHEFNYSIPALFKAFEGYRGEKLCGNVFNSQGRLLEGFKAYTVKVLKNGLRVAFIGMVSPNVDMWDRANFEDGKYIAVGAAEAARKVIGYLKSEDLADVFVFLGHMHIDNELGRAGSGANDVVRLNPEIDVFLGAHFHLAIGGRREQRVLNGSVKFVENKSSAATFGKVLVTATYEQGRWRVKNRIGTYEESDVKTDIINAVEDVALIVADPTIEMAHQYVMAYMRTVVGYLKGGPLVSPPEIKGTHEIILKPTAYIQLLTDIIIKYANVDVAAVAVNDYSVNCTEGPITLGKISQIYTYDNDSIYTLKMTGKQLLQWIEWSYSFFGQTINGVSDLTGPAVNLESDLTIPYGTKKVYLHDKFGGIEYEVDLTKKVGNRIKILKINKDSTAFNVNRPYKVATSSYRAATNLLINTQDGVFKDNSPCAELIEKNVKSPKNHIKIIDWVAEYIQEQTDKIVTNKYMPNWKFTNLNWDEELRTKTIKKINKRNIPYDHRGTIKKSDL